MARNSRSNFRRGISETQRRKKAWIDMNLGAFFGNDVAGGGMTPPDIVGVGESVALLQFPSQPGFAESTLLRIRGSLTVPKSDFNNNPGLVNVFTFGIGVVSDQSAEALAVPNPATATGYDWDGWMFLRTSDQSTVEAQATQVDVKAMRKWKSGDSIVFVAGMATSNSTGLVGQSFGFSLRGLFLLP